MIKNRQHIDLNGKTLIEKLEVKPPLRQTPVFQNEACFLYFNQGGADLKAPTERELIQEKEGIVLRCGSYLADLLENQITGLCEVCVIHFFPEVLQKAFQQEGPSFTKEARSEQYTYRLSQKNVIDHFMKSLSFYFEHPEMATEAILLLKIKELVLLLLHTEAADSIVELYSYLFNPQKATISEVVESHLYSNLTLEQMAFLAGQSLSTFKREFKKHYNESPAKYLRNKRLNKAAELLTHSSLNINEIAFKIGYEDSSYFSKIFLRRFDLLPSDYRKAPKK